MNENYADIITHKVCEHCGMEAFSVGSKKCGHCGKLAEEAALSINEQVALDNEDDC